MPKTWVYGNSYTSGGAAHQTGATYTSSKAAVLLSNRNYFTTTPPTYQGSDVSQFINVKGIPDFPVYGDGTHDDTINLNAIASQYAGCKILFFPSGAYLVTDTLFFPSGSIVVGEAWSTISAAGSKFTNAVAPEVMVRVGNKGDISITQFSDILFTVADILPGKTSRASNI